MRAQALQRRGNIRAQLILNLHQAHQDSSHSHSHHRAFSGREPVLGGGGDGNTLLLQPIGLTNKHPSRCTVHVALQALAGDGANVLAVQ